MKRAVHFLLALALVLGLCACGQNAEAAWQEQYDLGVRYLSEGNYQEAIIAFTAAIDIDPKRAEAYVGRGDAYIGSGETEDNLATALADYEAALELDETLADAWLGLADVYIRRGEYDKALEVLREALEKTGNDQSIADKLAEMEAGTYRDSAQNIRRSNTYDLDGTLVSYTEYEYDELGRRCGWSNYYLGSTETGEQGPIELINTCVVTFDDKNRPERYQFYDPEGELTEWDTFVYNEDGLKSEQYRYEADGSLNCYFYFYYNDAGLETRYEGYWSDGTMYSYWLSEYDENGELIRETEHDPETGEVIRYSTFD